MRFDGFDWDAANRGKCLKHGVSLAEIESLFIGTIRVLPDVTHSAQEQRYKAIGHTVAGRWVFLAFAWRRRDNQNLIRPISARYMHVQEIRRYEEMARPDK